MQTFRTGQTIKKFKRKKTRVYKLRVTNSRKLDFKIFDKYKISRKECKKIGVGTIVERFKKGDSLFYFAAHIRAKVRFETACQRESF